MSIQLEDGAGTRNRAKIGANLRLATDAVTQDHTTRATLGGNSYNLNTGSIELTSGSESGVAYLKNNGSQDLLVTGLVFGLSPSTGGNTSKAVTITVTKNPTSGSVVSDESDMPIKQNRNFGSTKTLTCDAYKGAEGKTLTGGSDYIISLVSPGSRAVVAANAVLIPGNSIGVKVTPQSSNTSMEVYVAIICNIGDTDSTL